MVPPHISTHRSNILLVASFSLLLAQGAMAQKIVFQSTQQNNNWEIFTMNADGSNQVNLTNDTGGDQFPLWSPDGTRIAFSSNRIDSEEVYVMNADGSDLQRLTNNLAIDRPIAWSPDGGHILFLSSRDSDYEVYIMSRDGNDVLRLTNSPGDDIPVQFSPDGSRVLFTSARTGNADIYSVGVTGGPSLNLTSHPSTDTAPHWSPDGSRIVFSSDRGADVNADVYSMAATGADVRRLTELSKGPALKPENRREQVTIFLSPEPFYSPGGSKILFRTNVLGGTRTFVMDADGGNITPLMDVGFPNVRPRWSADGARIITLKDRDIYIMNIDGTEQLRLTTSPGNQLHFDSFGIFGEPEPSISADGVVLATLLPTVQTVSPLAIISVFGEQFSTETILHPTLNELGEVDRILGSTCLMMNDEALPMFAVTPTQINAQVSADAGFGPASFTVVTNCGTAQALTSAPLLLQGPQPRSLVSAVEMGTIEEATPGFFLFPPLATNGFIAARFNATASQPPVAVAPIGMFDDEYGPSRPARSGDIIAMYGTGWGPVTPALGTGVLPTGPGMLLPESNISISFGGVIMANENILYVGPSPGAAGLFQATIRIQDNAQDGNNQVILNVYGKSTPIGPVVPVLQQQ